MKWAAVSLALVFLGALISAPVLQATEKSPHELYDALNALRVDPAAVYELKRENRIDLHRSDAKLSFEEGKLAFFAAFDGHITGAVFSGRGHILAVPRDPVERQQLGRFLGASLLDQSFTSGYLRFTDGAAEELLRELQAAGIAPQSDAEFAAKWESYLSYRNPAHSLRILFESLSLDAKPYFSASLDGVTTGPFDFMLDRMRPEQFLLGQLHKVETGEFYDVWTSYKILGAVVAPSPFRALHYAIDTSIPPNHSLDGTSTVRVRSEVGADRVIGFQLARTLEMESVSAAPSHLPH